METNHPNDLVLAKASGYAPSHPLCEHDWNLSGHHTAEVDAAEEQKSGQALETVGELELE